MGYIMNSTTRKTVELLCKSLISRLEIQKAVIFKSELRQVIQEEVYNLLGPHILTEEDLKQRTFEMIGTKGEEIETLILSVDPERERISLGIKQLDQDPFSDYTAVNDRGSIVNGVIIEVEPKEAVIQLAEEVTGVLKASEISIDRVEDARNVLNVNDEIEVKIISVDRKNRNISLSVKSKDVEDERQAVRDHRRQETDRAGPATLGDLIKAQMDQAEE